MTPFLTSDIPSLKTGTALGPTAATETPSAGLLFELPPEQEPPPEQAAELASVPVTFAVLPGLLPMQLAGIQTAQDMAPAATQAEATDLSDGMAPVPVAAPPTPEMQTLQPPQAPEAPVVKTAVENPPAARPASAAPQETGQEAEQVAGKVTRPAPVAIATAPAAPDLSGLASASDAEAAPPTATTSKHAATPEVRIPLPEGPAPQAQHTPPPEPSQPVSGRSTLSGIANIGPEQPQPSPLLPAETGHIPEGFTAAPPRKDHPGTQSATASKDPNAPQDVPPPPRPSLSAGTGFVATEAPGPSAGTSVQASATPDASASSKGTSGKPAVASPELTATTTMAQDQPAVGNHLGNQLPGAKFNPPEARPDMPSQYPEAEATPAEVTVAISDKPAAIVPAPPRTPLSDLTGAALPQSDITLPDMGTTTPFTAHPNTPQTVAFPTPENVQATPAIAQSVSGQIAFTVAQNPDGQTEITLSPEELGRVRLSVHSGDGSIAVTIQAERPETLELMRRNIELLQRDFRALGYEQMSFSFSQQGSGRSPERPPETPGPGLTEPSAVPIETPLTAPSLRPTPMMSDRSLDLRM